MHIKLHAALCSVFIIFITTAIQDRMRILASAAMSKNDWQEGEKRRRRRSAQGTFMHFCHEWVLTVKTRTWSNPHIKLGTGPRCREKYKKSGAGVKDAKRHYWHLPRAHGIDACELRPGYCGTAPHIDKLFTSGWCWAAGVRFEAEMARGSHKVQFIGII